MHESPTIRDPFPEHPFGGVILFRGEPDVDRSVSDVEITRNYHGEPLCFRCGEPMEGLPHELTFTRSKGKYRPCHKGCAHAREKVTGWPGPRGGEMVAVPVSREPGAKLVPNPVTKPGPDIVMVPNTVSLWSRKPGVSKYKRDR